MDPAMAAVTIKNLLTHTAGLPHDLTGWRPDNAAGLTVPQVRRLAVERALSSPPATPIGKYAYSNVGFIILGTIVEAKTGQPWEEVIRRRIFKSLNMQTAGFGQPGKPDGIDQPWGHVIRGGDLTPTQSENKPPYAAPAGQVHCSIEDWSKFVAEILRGAQGRPTLVSPDTFKELITPLPGQNYSGGWITSSRPWAGGTTLTHTGSNLRWFCVAWLAPNRNFAILVATNFGGAGADQATDAAVGELIKVNASLPPR
jgi:CubicO group peptidase (beta-lactamase class C family)